MECNDIQEKLSDYMEAVLSAEDKVLIDEHLKGCQKCREALADLKMTMEHIQSLDEVQPPAWLTQRVMARIREEAEAKKGILHRLFYPPHIKLPIEAVAVIAIALVSVYIFKAMQPEMQLAKAPTEEARSRLLQEEKERVSTTDKGRPTTAGPAEQFTRAEKKELPATEHPRATRVPDEVSRREYRMPSRKPIVRDESGREAVSSALGAKAMVGKRQRSIPLTIKVKDIDAASEKIEIAFKQLGGETIGRESLERKRVVAAKLDVNKLEQLLLRLSSIGEVGENIEDLKVREGIVEFVVEILPSDR